MKSWLENIFWHRAWVVEFFVPTWGRTWDLLVLVYFLQQEAPQTTQLLRSPPFVQFSLVSCHGQLAELSLWVSVIRRLNHTISFFQGKYNTEEKKRLGYDKLWRNVLLYLFPHDLNWSKLWQSENFWAAFSTLLRPVVAVVRVGPDAGRVGHHVGDEGLLVNWVKQMSEGSWIWREF